MKDYEYLVLEDSTVKITRYCGNENRITVPDSVNGCPVKALGAGAFQNCRELLSVAVPESVAEIGDMAFAGCASLLAVLLPENLSQMGEHLFEGCERVKVFACTDAKACAYARVHGLPYAIGGTWQQLAAVIRRIEPDFTDGSFTYTLNARGEATVTGYRGTGEREELRLPAALNGNPVKAIGDKAFAGRLGIKAFVIPGCVEHIGAGAFEGCAHTERILINEGVHRIGSRAFAASGLTEVVFPDSVTEIGAEACRFCRALTSVRLPEKLQKIEAHVFSGARSLKNVAIPDSVVSIAHGAFADTHHYGELIIPQTVENIADSAFALCEGLCLGVYPNSHGERFAKAHGIPVRLLDLP